MTEYIDKAKAIRLITGERPEPRYPEWYADKIRAMPSVDAVPVVHGKWIDRPTEGLWSCSECGQIQCCKDNFCGNCGADLRKPAWKPIF